MRRNRRRKRKKLEEVGPLSYRIAREGAEALAAVERALAFKTEWLDRHAIMSNAYADARFGEFWRSVATTPERPVGLTAFVLDLNGRPVAIEIGLRYQGAHYAHIGAFDVELEKSSPSASQMDGVIAACIADDIGTYDMLAPNADYKERIAVDFVAVRDYVLPLNAKGRAFDALRLNESRVIAKAAAKSLPPGLRKIIKSTLGV